MANKTKEQLLKEIEELTTKLGEVEDELQMCKEIEACDNMGTAYKAIYDNFIKAGFAKEEAFILLQETMRSTVHDFMREAKGNRSTYRSYRRY